MTTKFTFPLLALLVSSLSATDSLSAVINPLDGYQHEVTTIVNDKRNGRIEVKSFNLDATGCDEKTKMMSIEKVTMDSDDRYPAKMTVRDMSNIRMTMPTNFSLLDNASRSWTDGLFKEGDWVYVQYVVCGSGGFPQMTSISKKTEIFVSSGVTIN